VFLSGGGVLGSRGEIMENDQRNPDDYIDATGHRVYRGSRWHLPKTGEPTKCAVEGCPRVLGQADKVAE
jgi:hypothetical protein